MNIDLFAGAGGWAQAGVVDDLLGVELDRHAAQTHRVAFGAHSVVETDVRFVSPARIRRGQWVEGLIASPPCQTFSRAGKQSGHRVIPALVDAIKLINAGYRLQSVLKSHSLETEDERTLCVLEPARWIADLDAGGMKLAWVAFEQVPPVRPIFEAYEAVLRERGFSTWVGLINSGDYGVPQLRERAVLLASRECVVGRPHVEVQQRVMRDVLPAVSPDLPADAVLQPGSWVGASSRARKPVTLDEQAPTIAFGKDFSGWKWTSPSDPAFGRLASTEEISVLQGFPAHFPWAGTRTAAWHQIANAIPPPMAAAILRAVTDT